MTKTRDDAWALPDELLNPYPEQEPGPQSEPDHFATEGPYGPGPEADDEASDDGYEVDQ